MATRKKTAGVSEKTESQLIWEAIKDVDLELFALEDQTVEVHSDPVTSMSSTELHLLLKTAAALPQLEAIIPKTKFSGGKLEVEQKERFVVVRVVKS